MYCIVYIIGRESITLYYYEADSDIANADRPTWDAQTYKRLGVLAAERLFSDDSDVFINRVTLSLSVVDRAAGLYLAVRDQGSCTTVISLVVYHYVCAETTHWLAVFNRTSTAPFQTDVVPVHGVCVNHARPPHPTPVSYTHLTLPTKRIV